MTAPGPSPLPGTWREFWRLANRPTVVDGRGARLACAVLFVVYVLILVLRRDPEHAEFTFLRGIVCLYALLGIAIAGRVNWWGVRAYTVGLGLLMPFVATAVGGLRGHHPPDLAITALATFVPLVFLQTLVDVLVVTAGVIAGDALLLAVLPRADVPLPILCNVLGGALAGGVATGVMTILYRNGLQEGLTWWQRACDRERTLREFTEATALQVRSEGLLETLTDRFRSAFGGGQAVIVLAGEVAGACSMVAAEGARETAPLAAEIATLMDGAIGSRRPIVRERMTETESRQLAERLGVPGAVRCLVALPLVVEGVVGGIVVLTRPALRAISDDDVLLWQAMANQTGVAIANGRLLARLERALRAKSEFLSTMSHELRSPLHVVIGYAEMLREGGDVLGSAEIAGRIGRSAVDLLRLVEDTLTVAQLEAGRITVRADEFAPAEVLGELAEGVRTLPEAKHGVPVHWDVAAEMPRVRLDRLKFKEVVQNLVSNALKYTLAGEVRVTVTTREAELTVAVRDTGVGIPTDAQARIFEMFERVEQSNGRRPPGVGLGLYIVDRLVRAMRGSVELWSVIGQGSVFTVRLPTRLEPASETAAA
jgi:signal transduction histidine kinase